MCLQGLGAHKIEFGHPAGVAAREATGSVYGVDARTIIG